MSLDTIIEFAGAMISQKDQLVLSEETFKFDRGEFVYFISRVGSGKSSLIITIKAEITLQQGAATVSGYNLTNIKKRQILLSQGRK
jgi:cell division transport system ATP-binding protein